jgi:hypothetical protein
MDDRLTGLSTVAVIGLVTAIALLKPCLGLMTTPQDDFTRIRAHLEGPAGEAGPAMRVVDSSAMESAGEAAAATWRAPTL